MLLIFFGLLLDIVAALKGRLELAVRVCEALLELPYRRRMRRRKSLCRLLVRLFGRLIARLLLRQLALQLFNLGTQLIQFLGESGNRHLCLLLLLKVATLVARARHLDLCS